MGEEKEKEIQEIDVIPLQNSVLMPKTQVPMLVRDQRYVQIVKNSVANQKLIGLFTKRKGDISEVGCAGKIISLQETSRNVWNVIFEGMFRIKMIEKISENPLKVRFEILKDRIPEQEIQEKLKKDILKTALEYLAITGRSKDEIKRIANFIVIMPLEQVVNWGVMLHPMSVDSKLKLLATDDVGDRANELIRIIQNDIKSYKILVPFRPMIPKDPKVN